MGLMRELCCVSAALQLPAPNLQAAIGLRATAAVFVRKGAPAPSRTLSQQADRATSAQQAAALRAVFEALAGSDFLSPLTEACAGGSHAELTRLANDAFRLG